MACGRPISFKLNDIDCLLPEDTDAIYDQYGNVVTSPWYWKIRFSKEMSHKVTAKFCSSKPVTYAEVLELDRAIQDYKDRIVFPSPVSAARTYPTQQTSDVLQDIAVQLYKNVVLMHIHRGFFAEALMKYPSNPLQSPFAHSFTAAYRGSVKLLGIARTRFDEMSHLLIRMWPIWAHSLTAAVIVGSVALHCRGNSMAGPAAIELDHAIALFEKAVIHPIVQTGLPILLRLRTKAREHARHSLPHPSRRPGSSIKNRDGLYGIRLIAKGESGNYRSDDDSGDDEHELSLLRGGNNFIEMSSAKTSNQAIRNQGKADASLNSPVDMERDEKHSLDPFGLFQYGGLSDSQFVEGHPEYLDGYSMPLDSRTLDDDSSMPDYLHGSDGSLMQSTQPEDAWQSFVQTLGFGDLQTM